LIEVSIERDYDVPAEAVWTMLADFGDISWIPGIENVVLEGRGVGMVRHVTAPGLPELHERMDALDPERMILDYSVPQVAYIQVKDYTARARVEALGEERCRLHWSCRAEPDGIDEAQATANTRAFYEMIVSWVGDYLKREA